MTISIMVSNDDGVKSMGIDALARAMQDIGDVKVVAPDQQQTARAKALTFHRPIRITETTTYSGIDATSYDAPPAVSVIIYEHFHGKPDLTVSGINSGDNTSIHSILTSGTAAVAMEAGMKGLKAIAYSMDVPDKFFYTNEVPGQLLHAAKLATVIATSFLEASDEFWSNTMFLNVNFPKQLDTATAVVYTPLESYKYQNYLVERVDPSQRKYFWLWGEKREDFDERADSFNLYRNHVCTITPVSFDGNSKRNDVVTECKRIIYLIDKRRDGM